MQVNDGKNLSCKIASEYYRAVIVLLVIFHMNTSEVDHFYG